MTKKRENSAGGWFSKLRNRENSVAAEYLGVHEWKKEKHTFIKNFGGRFRKRVKKWGKRNRIRGGRSSEDEAMKSGSLKGAYEKKNHKRGCVQQLLPTPPEKGDSPTMKKREGEKKGKEGRAADKK